MAIYPVIPGQKLPERNAIPPRTSTERSRPSTAKTPAPKPASEPANNDLIDFGDSDTPAAPVPAENPAIAAAAEKESSKGSAEIRQMLNETGQKAPEGPLIDFTTDMKANLPKTHPELKRSSTQDSNDEFFDVES
jgi:hypothetical protein